LPCAARDALQLAGDEIERLVPRDRDERLAAPALAAAGARLAEGAGEVAGADHRPADARRIVERARYRAADRRRLGVVGGRRQRADAAVCDLDVEAAPVIRGRHGARLLGAIGHGLSFVWREGAYTR